MTQEPERIDIGHGHAIRPFVVDGEIIGYEDWHPTPTGEDCQGFVYVKDVKQGKRPVWTVEQENPLTLSPSLLCAMCGDHGYIREGRWVPA